jgi:protein-glucosylgalactosylhydroxylysine glucosidase
MKKTEKDYPTGQNNKTLYFFEKALLPYKKGPFAILALRPYLTTTFFGTSSGGLMQALILGFGGLHFTEKGLVQKDPCLPEGWKSITLKGIGNNQDFLVK